MQAEHCALPSLPIHTDTTSNDAVALVMAAAAAAAGRIRLHAVTTVAGNVPLARTTRNALVTLELAGAGSVPVHQGCDRPVVREAATAKHVHGPDGMSDTELPDSVAAAADGHAVDLLLRAASEHGHELTLVTLGPLTNVAAALLRDRELLQRFRHTTAWPVPRTRSATSRRRRSSTSGPTRRRPRSCRRHPGVGHVRRLGRLPPRRRP